MRYEVLVKPGAKKDEMTISDTKIVIRTTKRAHDGEANVAVVNMLAKHFHIAKGKIKIVRGVTSRNKIVEIES